MHFHLPKPLHGWCEFAGEVGIIVVGVLIALGAEQLVQSLSHRSEAQEARANIRAELALNIGRMQNADGRIPCKTRRLEEISEFIKAARTGRSLADVKWIGRPPVWDMQTSRWQSAAASGRASLFGPDEQAGIADLYSLMTDYEAEERVEQEAWAKLRGLEGLTAWSEARDASLSDALQQARYAQWLLKIDSEQAQEVAGRLGIRGKPIAPYLSPLCIPTNVTRDEALKRLGESAADKYGEPL